MVQAEVRLVWKLLLTDLGIMVLLLLTDFCGGQSLSSQSVVAMIGDDVMLPCQLDPVVDATSLTVEWARPDLQPTFVHLRHEDVELDVEENPSYKGRTSLNETKLKHGDLSLKLFKVKLSDAGIYKCFVPTLDMESVVELVVETTMDQTELQFLMNDEGKKTTASVESEALEELEKLIKRLMDEIKAAEEAKEELLKQRSEAYAHFEEYEKEKERKFLEYQKHLQKQDDDV
ncbi:uncharacterized protein V6R79_007375 [Siganus canaliculatus]